MLEKCDKPVSSTISLRNICLDCFLLISVSGSVLVVKNFGIVFQRGFFCNDENILYPFVKSAIQNQYYHPTGMLLVSFAVILTEILQERGNSELLCIWKLKIPSWFYRTYQALLCFYFGLSCAMLTVTVTKSAVGRLRPHFLTVCAPNIDCTAPHNQNVYHVNFTCTNNLNKPGRLLNARLSFPSGHSNFAMFCAIFFVMYVQQRMTWPGSKLLKLIIQFSAVLSSVYIGLTRISDYYHHWSDVFGGFVIGGVCALCVTLKIIWPFSTGHITSGHI